jgi:hypothetical protein
MPNKAPSSQGSSQSGATHFEEGMRDTLSDSAYMAMFGLDAASEIINGMKVLLYPGNSTILPHLHPSFVQTAHTNDAIMHAVQRNKGAATGTVKTASTVTTTQLLPYTDHSFDFALVSHYLFTYSQEITLESHLQIITELTRVANEVRIFPILTKNSEFSSHLGPIIQHFNSLGFKTELRTVNFTIQPGGNAVLIISMQTCKI